FTFCFGLSFVVFGGVVGFFVFDIMVGFGYIFWVFGLCGRGYYYGFFFVSVLIFVGPLALVP
ncbi:hypothetical protein QN402_32015, partial [Pseudomonas sp. FG1]|nr:hypothetical protein [Pseudomonas sp. FG1]